MFAKIQRKSDLWAKGPGIESHVWTQDEKSDNIKKPGVCFLHPGWFF